MSVPNKNLNLSIAVLLALLFGLLVWQIGGTENSDGTQAARPQAEPRPEAPPVRVPPGVIDLDLALARLCEGEGILDTGRYSRDQQKHIFEREYKGKPCFAHGEIVRVGIKYQEKYITIILRNGHSVDIFPLADFDLLSYSKNSTVAFVREWRGLGTGILQPHKICDAIEQSQFR